ncbi:hypothetical protein M9H77_07815 [Catharanthus roseus]|uniref:Uncharacterized protein n=1 Tax=Catharanthus roseus TaxID=4058 RepID=A0ACC0BW04_CATRO|nr:hypothetical protein M9H77_07815 [Catharanthus roseus]
MERGRFTRTDPCGENSIQEGSIAHQTTMVNKTEDDLILRACGFIFLLLGGHMLPDISSNLVHVRYLRGERQIGGALVLLKIWAWEDYIRWYRDVTRVYIGNPTNRGTRTVGYQPTGVDKRMMELDDMATGVIEGPPSSLTQIISFAKSRLSSALHPSCRRPWEPVLKHGARGVKRCARRFPTEARGGRLLVPSYPGRRRNADPGCGGKRVTSLSDTVSSSFQAPPPPSTVSLFLAPPPLWMVGSSTPHMPIFNASSSVSDERTNDATPAQQLGFGHHVGKKTTRFTPSDWP